MRGWLITGTDTGVGKTVVAAALARYCREQGYRVGVCKPVATGVPEGAIGEDTRALLEAANLPLTWALRVTPLAFPEPAAPTVAARLLNRSVDFEAVVSAVLWWRDHADWLVVEGIGGLLCPLTPGKTVADLAVALKLPVVVVARTALGTLNHTLLTVEAAKRRHLNLVGIILNEATKPTGSWAERTCEQELQQWVDIPILGRIPHSELPERAARRVVPAILAQTRSAEERNVRARQS
ncbi:MAG: dethiobiotin synthase [Gemmatales bacterium]|nr:dethiobiotin synthase [Gemmatales bacterium]MDW7994517.1 dethiobiotin synthase [Gemmatales bacterium]